MNKPKIRTISSEKEWKTHTINEIAEIKRGKRITLKDINEKIIGFPVMSGGVEKMGMYSNWNRDENTITIAQYGTAGFVNFVKEKFWANDVCLSILPKKNINNDFLFFNLLSKQKYFFSITNKNTVPFSISIDDIKSTKINIPDLVEQTNIANIFKSTENLIQKTLLKLTKLNDLKKSLLDNMLVNLYANNNQNPKIRFKNFTYKWNCEKIGDLFKVTRGYVLPISAITSNIFGKNIFPVYSSKTENNGLLGYYNEFLYSKAITWTTDGANAGTVNYRDQKFYCSNVCGVLLQKKAKPSLFFSELINKECKKYVMAQLGNPKLMNNVMSSVEVFFPTEREQDEISCLLYLINEIIIKETKKYQKLLQIQETLLQELII